MVTMLKPRSIYVFRSRHCINLVIEFIRDGAFPFGSGEEKLIAEIGNQEIVIDKNISQYQRLDNR
jgi:hypothetical protein